MYQYSITIIFRFTKDKAICLDVVYSVQNAFNKILYMAIYCVTYDLISPNQDYDAIHEYLEEFEHCKHLELFWLIKSNKKASEIKSELKSLIDSDDIVFVARLQGSWAVVQL